MKIYDAEIVQIIAKSLLEASFSHLDWDDPINWYNAGDLIRDRYSAQAIAVLSALKDSSLAVMPSVLLDTIQDDPPITPKGKEAIRLETIEECAKVSDETGFDCYCGSFIRALGEKK